MNKADDLKFRTECTLEVLTHGAKPINETVRNGNYRIEGTKNSLEVFFDSNLTIKMFSVFCRFDNLNELTGKMNTKHNFFSTAGCDEAIKEFETFLHECLTYLN